MPRRRRMEVRRRRDACARDDDRPRAAGRARRRRFAEVAEAHLDDVFGYLSYLTRDRVGRRGSRELDVREGAPALGAIRPAPGERADMAPRHRADDRARLVPRRGPPPEARGGGGAPRARRGGIRRGALAGARGGARDAERGRARGARAADRARAGRRRRRPRARNQPDGRLDAAQPGAEATRGEGERGMTVTEIVDELRATRPRASDALRLQVLTLASSPPAQAPSFLDRLRGRRLAAARPGGRRPRRGGRGGDRRDAAAARPRRRFGPATVERSAGRARHGLRGAARGGRRGDRAEGRARAR